MASLQARVLQPSGSEQKQVRIPRPTGQTVVVGDVSDVKVDNIKASKADITASEVLEEFVQDLVWHQHCPREVNCLPY